MNAARARYFALRETDDPTVGGPELIEKKDLANPEATAPERGLFANLRGSNRAHAGGPEHNYDDHRTEHAEETNRRFAKTSIAEADAMMRQLQGDTLILVANPGMLGKLRPLLQNHGDLANKVIEFAKDLSVRPTQAIHEALAAEGLLPARSDPTHTRNGRPR